MSPVLASLKQHEPPTTTTTSRCGAPLRGPNAGPIRTDSGSKEGRRCESGALLADIRQPIGAGWPRPRLRRTERTVPPAIVRNTSIAAAPIPASPHWKPLEADAAAGELPIGCI